MCAKVIFKKLEVPLVSPVDLARGTNAIIKTQRACLGFPWRAAPPALCVETVSMRIVFGQPDQIFFRFPFFPTCLRSAKDEEVWRVDDCQMSSVRALVSEFQGRRLIVILETPRIMLHLVNAGQLDPVTLELDSDAHLPAGISPAYILAATPDPARRRRGSNMINRRTRRFGQTQTFVPVPQILGAEHDRRPLSSPLFLPRFPTPFPLPGMQIAHTRLVH